MKSALFGFALTAALLALNVLPNPWGNGPRVEAGSIEAQHVHEDKAKIAAELGLEHA